MCENKMTEAKDSGKTVEVKRQDSDDNLLSIDLKSEVEKKAGAPCDDKKESEGGEEELREVLVYDSSSPQRQEESIAKLDRILDKTELSHDIKVTAVGGIILCVSMLLIVWNIYQLQLAVVVLETQVVHVGSAVQRVQHKTGMLPHQGGHQQQEQRHKPLLTHWIFAFFTAKKHPAASNDSKDSKDAAKDTAKDTTEDAAKDTKDEQGGADVADQPKAGPAQVLPVQPRPLPPLLPRRPGMPPRDYFNHRPLNYNPMDRDHGLPKPPPAKEISDSYDPDDNNNNNNNNKKGAKKPSNVY